MGFFSDMDTELHGPGVGAAESAAPLTPDAKYTKPETAGANNDEPRPLAGADARATDDCDAEADDMDADDADADDADADDADAKNTAAAAGGDTSKNEQVDEKRRAHEESEAKRKAEWEAMHAAKIAAYDKAFLELLEMSDENITDQSVKRADSDLERLTRRNLKVCVTEHIKSVCRQDPSFARFVCYPSKSLINCFKYINQKAEGYIKQELELLGQKATGAIGEDVPDDLCYQWAEDYFRDLDAEIDKSKDDEFVPKQYYGSVSGSKSKKKEPAQKKEPAKKPEAEKKAPPASANKAAAEQLSLFGGAALWA